MDDPKAPRDPEISWDLKDLFEEPWRGQKYMAGMNQREPEEFLLAYGPRKVRKAIQKAAIRRHVFNPNELRARCPVIWPV